jgi:hypothetical protein
MTPRNSCFSRPLALLGLVAVLHVSGAGCSPVEGTLLPDGGECLVDCEGEAADGGPARDKGERLSTTAPDGGTGGVRDGGATPVNGFPALQAYYACRSDTDCPIGLGECVKEVPFSRQDGTAGERVAVSSIDPRIPEGQGICTRVCTLDESACETLALKDADGVSRPFTCQVVATGEAPYPASLPAFPFAAQLDAGAMAAGQPFASVCRPPFGLHNAVADDFCGSCTATSGCSGLCYDFLTGAEAAGDAQGTCLAVAPEAGCPFGFEARALAGEGTFCAPLHDAAGCGGCIDRDGDLRGTGQCWSRAYDCDDRNANAHFSGASSQHPFPLFCGDFDYNCNGLSDRSEQVGVAAYAAFHCEFCGDNGHGSKVNVGTPSEATLACVSGKMQAQSCANPGRIHCAGDVRQTGCEASAQEGGVVYYQDLDRDGFGNPLVSSLGCPGGSAPDGYVTQGGDCNDTDAAIRPNVPDRCDCWGDCAQAGKRVDNDCDGTTDEDVTGYRWFSDADLDGVPGAVAFGGALSCGAPASGLVPQSAQASTSDCNDTNALTYGPHQRVTTAAGVNVALPLSAEPPRDASGNLYLATRGAAAETCDVQDNDCDGTTDEGVQTTFYRDLDSDGHGNPAAPALACGAPEGYVANNTDCNDTSASIYLGAPELCDLVDQDCDGAANDAPTGGACNTGLQGICAAGTQTACAANGTWVCTQNRAREVFDDPKTGEDEDCDGAEKYVYLDNSGSDDHTGLTPGSPVKTISRAQQVARDNNATQILMVDGMYSLASSQYVDMHDGVDLVGGYTRSGSVYTPGTGKATISQSGAQSYQSRAVAVVADGLSSHATLANIAIQVRSPAGPSTDTIGIWARNTTSHFHLRNVDVTVERAADGESGTTGAAGAAGPSANLRTPGSMTCHGSTVSGGAGTNSGAAGAAGNGAHAGAAQSSNGAGNNGGSGSSAAPGGTNTSPYFPLVKASAFDGSTGWNGSGGSGGGPKTFLGGWTTSGGGGAGGCRGDGGNGGDHGGSAIAIVLWNAAGTTMSGVTGTLGGGGNGGNGGRGGAGGNGGTGGGSTDTGNTGGQGSGGQGGGGGAGGHGGWNVGVLAAGTSESMDWCATRRGDETDFKNASETTTSGRGGEGGLGGTGGLIGSTNTRVLSGGRGASGLNGTQSFCEFLPTAN